MRATFQVLPALADAELEALRESVAAVGVLQPVVVDEHGTIIDGHHRAQVCAELGIEYPTAVVPGLSEPQKLEMALTLNLGRRHLTPAQKRSLVERLRAAGCSVRWISDQTGIPRSTVQRYSAGVPGGTPTYVSGTDGKRYRARFSFDPLERWRKTWAQATRLADVPATVDELANLQDDPAAEDASEEALEQYLGELAAKHLLTHGMFLPAPLHLHGIDGSSPAARDAIAAWETAVETRARQFLDWCTEAGISFDDAGHWGELPGAIAAEAEALGRFACWMSEHPALQRVFAVEALRAVTT
jgi:ParB-like chromosome segregation protein Spo0J